MIRSGQRCVVLLGLALAVAAASGCAGKKAARTIPSTPGWFEEGIASWYGGKYHGRTTANGERYDMHELTAAHPSLPFGTLVRVTHLGNGRVVEVRINDRGPFVKGRIIDLSRAAARELDMLREGVARVKIEVLR